MSSNSQTVDNRAITGYSSSGINIPQLLIAGAEAFILGYDLKYGAALVGSIAISNLLPNVVGDKNPWVVSGSTEKYILEPAIAAALCFGATHIIKGKKKPHRFAAMGFIAGASSAAVGNALYGSYQLYDNKTAVHANRVEALRAQYNDKNPEEKSMFSYMLA